MLSNIAFKNYYRLTRPEIIKFYNFYTSKKHQVTNIEEYQLSRVKDILKYSSDYIPYYKKLFNELDYRDFKKLSDLKSIPIVNKRQIMRENESFVNDDYLKREKVVRSNTGGSTGQPLSYFMSNECYSRGVALLYRGWGLGGYKLGDKVAVIGGSSIAAKKRKFKNEISERATSIRRFSTSTLTEEELYNYYYLLRKWKPKFIRGFPTAINIFGKFIEENNLNHNLELKGIFTTGEQLLPTQRKFLSHTFNTNIYNNYGLNDGGLSAFECKDGKGMHIDIERSLLEVVNDDGEQVYDEIGRIIATTFHNYAMPFIRYDTGDLGVITKEKCSCGCYRPLLKSINGRQSDYLKLNGIIIGSPGLNFIFSDIEVLQYKIVQINSNELDVHLKKGKSFREEHYNLIKNRIEQKVGPVKVNFLNIEDHLTDINKFKSIINNVCK